jgi:hypothetical protein
MLGRTERVAGGRVHHHDAQPRCRFFIDIVGPHAGPRDRLQAMIPLQRRRIDRHATTAYCTVEFSERFL